MEDFDVALAMAPASAFAVRTPASVYALRCRGVFRLNGGNLQVKHQGFEFMTAVAVNTVPSYKSRSLSGRLACKR